MKTKNIHHYSRKKVFYTYILIDPRNDHIFYVGKGKGYRCKTHTYPKRLEKDTPKNSIIKQIIDEGMEPIIEKIGEGMTEKQAFDLEIFTVALIGKENLTNETTGGQGQSGRPGPWRGRHHTEKTKKLLRKIRLGPLNPNYGKKRSKEAIEKFRKNHSGKKHWAYGRSRTEEEKEKIRKKLKGIKLTDE